MKTPALLEYVRPIAAAGQDLHLLPLYAQANLDPLQALRIQGGRAEHLCICVFCICIFVYARLTHGNITFDTILQSSFQKYTTCWVFLALRHIFVYSKFIFLNLRV